MEERKPRDSAVKVRQATLLTPSVPQLDFGTLPSAGKREITFSLHNPGDRAVEVAQVETSCDCFRVALQTSVVAPGENALATAEVDLTDDPKFTGRLRLVGRGLAKKQATCGFVIYAELKVDGPGSAVK